MRLSPGMTRFRSPSLRCSPSPRARPGLLLLLLLLVSLSLASCGETAAPAEPFDPTTAEAELVEVLTRLRAGDPEGALAAWDAQASTTGVPEGAFHYRALALADAGRIDEALEVWDDELERHPGNGRAHVLVAEALLGRGRLDDAADHLQQAREVAPELPMLSLIAGRLALQRNDDEAATRAFRDLLEVDPWGIHASAAHHALFQIAARRGDPAAALHERASAFLEQFHAALAYSRAVLAEDPDNVLERFRVGAAYQNLYMQANGSPIFGPVPPRWLREALDNSEAAFHAVLAVDPTFARATFNLGNIRRQQDRLHEAVAYFRETLAIDAAHVGARLNLARVLRILNDEAGAYAELLAVFEHTDDRIVLAPALVMLADIEERRSDWAAAASRLEVLMEWFPDDPQGLFPRLEALRALAAPR